MALLSGAVDELSDRILEDQVAAGVVHPEAPPPGEGAAMLMLETAAHANARRAKPLAWIRGLAFATETLP